MTSVKSDSLNFFYYFTEYESFMFYENFMIIMRTCLTVLQITIITHVLY